MRCQSYADWDVTPPRGGGADAKTLVLLGKTGNGKSATGNSILGLDAFESMPCLGGVTSTCQFATTVLENGQTLNVIDTPGLFDSSVEPRVMAEEIAKCINLAKDGIHAVILVLSVRNRFSEEEASAFESLCQIFGGKIADYMIVVFAHADALGENRCLDDLLSRNCPELLKRILEMCGDRRIAFDNMTGDEGKISRQRRELFSLVDSVVASNDGKPYTNDLFDELRKGEMKLIDQTTEVSSSMGELDLIDHTTKANSCQGNLLNSYPQFERLIEMVELRLNQSIMQLEKQLAEERIARLEAESKAKEAQSKSKDELGESMERSKRAEKLSKELQKKLNKVEAAAPPKSWGCVILLLVFTQIFLN